MVATYPNRYWRTGQRVRMADVVMASCQSGEVHKACAYLRPGGIFRLVILRFPWTPGDHLQLPNPYIDPPVITAAGVLRTGQRPAGATNIECRRSQDVTESVTVCNVPLESPYTVATTPA